MNKLEKWSERFYHFLSSRNKIAKNLNIPKTSKIKGSTLNSDVRLGNDITIINSKIAGNINIDSNNWIINATLSGNILINKSCRFYNCRIDGVVTIGKHSSVWGPNSHILSIESAPITIGSFCSIARNVSIQSFNHNYKKATSYFIGQNFFKEKWENERVTRGGIVVENDVWIGSDCVILAGVNIKNGAVVAANSVVTKDVPSYAIVAGSPAHIIGYRFEMEIIEKLQETQWWNWSDIRIKNNKQFFENEISRDSFNNIL